MTPQDEEFLKQALESLTEIVQAHAKNFELLTSIVEKLDTRIATLESSVVKK